MKCLWIGVGNSAEGRAHTLKNGAKLLSAEVSNDALLAGLEANGIFCDTINSSRIANYPQYPEKIITPFSWTCPNGTTGISVSYLNYKYIDLISKKRALVKEAKKWAKQNVNNDVTVFIYQMHTPFMAAADAVKKIIPSAKIVLIVPDLPQFMDMNMSRLKKFLKAIDWEKICGYMKRIDKYILYSKHMADFLRLKEDSWMVMEGSYDPTLVIDDGEIKKDDGKISVMYSGVLDLRYGIKELLDTMSLLDDNYELWLTGNGNAVPLIKERAETDPRIKYYGFLPSRLDLLKKQHEATMLISTRDPSEEASAYCFPSKIFEYMVSGNPVLSTKIKGIPDEYFDHIMVLPDIKPETLAKKITEVAEMPKEERDVFSKVASEFVVNNKNNVAQTKKMIEFLKGEQ